MIFRKYYIRGFLLSLVLCFMIVGCQQKKNTSQNGSSENTMSGLETKINKEAAATRDKNEGENKSDLKEKAGTDNKRESGHGSEVKSEQSTDPSEADQIAEGKSEQGIMSYKVSFDSSWKYAKYSKINSGVACLYQQKEDNNNIKNYTVCINAGHGTRGGSSVKTRCHPDGSPKVTSGTTQQGQTEAVAVSEGMTFPDGTREAEATLSLAKLVKEKLLKAGYNVLMIREEEDVQLDNIARTLMANNKADCHIALHYDDTETDKGAFFLSVPDVKEYKAMEPVKDHWKEHDELGHTIVGAMKKTGIHLYHNGSVEMDLTQTSYSLIPSIDLEVGDGGSDISKNGQEKIAEGILKGINHYYKHHQ